MVATLSLNKSLLKDSQNLYSIRRNTMSEVTSPNSSQDHQILVYYRICDNCLLHPCLNPNCPNIKYCLGFNTHHGIEPKDKNNNLIYQKQYPIIQEPQQKKNPNQINDSAKNAITEINIRKERKYIGLDQEQTRDQYLCLWKRLYKLESQELRHTSKQLPLDSSEIIKIIDIDPASIEIKDA